MKAEDTDEISRLAFDRAIADYIRSRREKVPEFVAKYFSFKGAMQLNKKAFGADLYKVPLNVAWSVPYLSMKVSAALFKKLGLDKIPGRIDKIPPGFETRVQKEINWLIFTDLLELPYSQKDRTFHNDALLAEIIDQPAIAPCLPMNLQKYILNQNIPAIRPPWKKI